MTKRRVWLVFLLICLFITGCAVLPIYQHPNVAQQAEPDEPVGTYNASLQVPWYLNFNSVSAAQAARCRRYLVIGTPSPISSKSPCQGVAEDDNFVALALSGGDSRSAALSAAIMWELDRLGIMQHVDVISAVSGGAQAAALYALQTGQTDAHSDKRLNHHTTLQHGDSERAVAMFENNLTVDWVLSLLLPWNMAATMFTDFDRTDVMANTFASKYYGSGRGKSSADGLRFRDINPKRPNLIMNAVDMSYRANENEASSAMAGECFALSFETFRDRLGSDLHNFPIAQAVMATNTFPGLHQYYSLKEFPAPASANQQSFVHLADGSIRDHLALVPINAMLRKFAEARSLTQMRPIDITEACQFSRGAVAPRPQRAQSLLGNTNDDTLEDRPRLPKKVLVIVIDAGIPPKGVEKKDANPGGAFLNKIIPVSMVVDAIDTALDDQRALGAIELLEIRKHLTGKKKTELQVWRCLHQHGNSMDHIAHCLSTPDGPEIDAQSGVLGPACCPIIGMGIHNFMKFAADKFGPVNLRDLDSGKSWGADLITLECMADNDFGRGVAGSLYSNMRTIDLGLSLDSQELGTIKLAARALVDEMLIDFCDHELHGLGGVAEIKCTPRAETRKVACQI